MCQADGVMILVNNENGFSKLTDLLSERNIQSITYRTQDDRGLVSSDRYKLTFDSIYLFLAPFILFLKGPGGSMQLSSVKSIELSDNERRGKTLMRVSCDNFTGADQDDVYEFLVSWGI